MFPNEVVPNDGGMYPMNPNLPGSSTLVPSGKWMQGIIVYLRYNLVTPDPYIHPTEASQA